MSHLLELFMLIANATTATGGPLPAEARTVPGGDLVFHGLDSVVRLNERGETLQEVDVKAGRRWIRFTVPDERTQLLCEICDEHSGPALQLVDVDTPHGTTHLVELPHPTSQFSMSGLTRAYSLGHGESTLMGIGHGLFDPFVPTILETNGDRSVVAQKELAGRDEVRIQDDLHTDVPGGWVVIRSVNRGYGCVATTFLQRY